MSDKRNAFDERQPWLSPPAFLAARARDMSTGKGLQVRSVEVTSGGRILPHAEPETLWLFCTEGHATLTLAGEELPLRPGDLLTVPGGTVRALLNGGAETVRLLLLGCDCPPPPPSLGTLLHALGKKIRAQ